MADAGAGDEEPSEDPEPPPTEEPGWPATLPKSASGSDDFINAALTTFKPASMTAHHAREQFHALDKNVWKLLGRARQCEKYVALMDGSIWNVPATA